MVVMKVVVLVVGEMVSISLTVRCGGGGREVVRLP